VAEVPGGSSVSWLMSSKNKRMKAAAKAAASSVPVYNNGYELGLRAQWPDGRVGEWLARQVLLRLKRGDIEPTDNWRWAEEGVKVQEEAYASARSKGCCGFEDFVLVHPSGRRFRIGFNYGH
jgi:hypothetical protein